MKKILILPLLLGVMVANAQLKLGLKGGANISNFSGDFPSGVEKSSLTSFHAGGVVRWIFGHLVLQPELLFSQQGAKFKSGTTEEDYKVNYLTIPVMLQWQFKGSFYVEGGPQAGFKLSEEIPDNANVDDFAKSSDVSVALGAGFMKREGGLGLSGRYVAGVTQVGDYTSSPDFKNGVWQISLTFIFK